MHVIPTVIPPAINAIQHYKKRAFLAAFTRCGSISKAAKRAKVDRNMHYWWLRTDPLYPAAFAAAKEQALDALEDMLHDCAMEDRHVVAAIVLLKAGRPELYKDRIEHSGSVEINTAEVIRERRQQRLLALPAPVNGHAS